MKTPRVSIQKQPLIEKLPKWAQDHIQQLTNAVDSLNGYLQQVSTYKVNGLPGIKFHLEHDGPWYTVPSNFICIFLPNGTQVQLRIDHDVVNGHHIYVMADRGVRVQGSSHNTLALIPEEGPMSRARVEEQS